MNREPIFWTTTQPGYNDSDRQRTIMVEGKRRTEKFPQRGHVGDYDDRKIAPGERWMLAVRHDGHEVRAPLTNGAAHMDTATSYAQYVRVKARKLGWFHPGQCPCALIGAGEMDPNAVASDEVRKGTPCQPGTYNVNKRCPHALAEQAARRAAHNEIQSDKEASSKTKEDKILDAMREQTAALMAGRASGTESLAEELGFASVAAMREFMSQKKK